MFLTGHMGASNQSHVEAGEMIEKTFSVPGTSLRSFLPKKIFILTTNIPNDSFNTSERKIVLCSNCYKLQKESTFTIYVKPFKYSGH